MTEPLYLSDRDVCHFIGVRLATLHAWVSRGHVHRTPDGIDLREVWAYAMRTTRGRRR